MRVRGVREIPYKANCIACKQICYVAQADLVGLTVFQNVEVICNHCSTFEDVDLDEFPETEIEIPAERKCFFANLISGIRRMLTKSL
jgi:hypothetical protein